MNNNVYIGILGFGNIGSYFYKTVKKNINKIYLKTGKKPIIKYISVKNFFKKRKIKIPNSQLTKNPMNLIWDKKISIIVEVVGGSDGIAKKIVFAALKNKKNVITANKALISKHGDKLGIIAEKNNVNLEYEAAVAGGIPIIKSIKEGLIANKINKVYGILNGTTNYILSNMEKNGNNFADVLLNAKKKGYAESNPASDLNGTDSASKIKILSSIAFNKNISKNKILKEGIEKINQVDLQHAKTLGYKIKLLGISEIINNQLLERVHPCLVLKNSYIANINGILNAVVVDAFPVGKTVLQGEGAGPGPTTSALISDLCSILKGDTKLPFGVSYKKRKNISKFDPYKRLCSSYLRVEVKDLPGVLSSITKIFSKNKISIKNLIQVPFKKNNKASIVIITHKNLESRYSKLLNNLCRNKYVVKKPVFIRVENI
jgi:homoserine dehydrogenase